MHCYNLLFSYVCSFTAHTQPLPPITLNTGRQIFQVFRGALFRSFANLLILLPCRPSAQMLVVLVLLAAPTALVSASMSYQLPAPPSQTPVMDLMQTTCQGAMVGPQMARMTRSLSLLRTTSRSQLLLESKLACWKAFPVTTLRFFQFRMQSESSKIHNAGQSSTWKVPGKYLL